MTTAMKAKIHVLKKQIGLDNETYRSVLLNLTGYESSACLSKDQLAKVIDHLVSKKVEFKETAVKNSL